MLRRTFLTSLCALPLTSCTGENASIRFKVIAMALVDGQPVECCAVMDITYSKVTHSLIGTGGAARLLGEAIIFDLGSRGTFYILPYWRYQGSLSQIYQEGLTSTFGIKHGIGSLSDADWEVLRSVKGRRPFNYYGHLPLFITFTNELDPSSIIELDPFHLKDRFPGVRFTGLDIEITNEPVTEKVTQRLQWLAIRNKILFPRDPPGHLRAERDLPLAYVIQQGDFFGR